MGSRAFARPHDLQLLLGLAQELWPAVQCTYGELAWLSSSLAQDDWEGRLWFDGDRLVGWGLLASAALEFQTRATHGALLHEILDWATP
jgi:hypothetical protein